MSFSISRQAIVIDASAAMELLVGNDAWLARWRGWNEAGDILVVPAHFGHEVANALLVGLGLPVRAATAAIDRLFASGLDRRGRASRRVRREPDGWGSRTSDEEGPAMNFDLYVWAAPRDLETDAAAELIEAWEAAGGDPAQSPFELSTDIGWYRRELRDALPDLEVSSDAIPRVTRVPIVLSGDDEAPARVIAIRLPRADPALLREAVEEVYSLALKYDTVVYDANRGAVHHPNREMSEAASLAFWPRDAIRTVVPILIGLAVAIGAWQVGIPLLSGGIALFAAFMVGIFLFILVSEGRKALERRGAMPAKK